MLFRSEGGREREGGREGRRREGERKEERKESVGENVEKFEPSCIASGNVK